MPARRSSGFRTSSRASGIGTIALKLPRFVAQRMELNAEGVSTQEQHDILAHALTPVSANTSEVDFHKALQLCDVISNRIRVLNRQDIPLETIICIAVTF